MSLVARPAPNPAASTNSMFRPPVGIRRVLRHRPEPADLRTQERAQRVTFGLHHQNPRPGLAENHLVDVEHRPPVVRPSARFQVPQRPLPRPKVIDIQHDRQIGHVQTLRVQPPQKRERRRQPRLRVRLLHRHRPGNQLPHRRHHRAPLDLGQPVRAELLDPRHGLRRGVAHWAPQVRRGVTHRLRSPPPSTRPRHIRSPLAAENIIGRRIRSRFSVTTRRDEALHPTRNGGTTGDGLVLLDRHAAEDADPQAGIWVVVSGIF